MPVEDVFLDEDDDMGFVKVDDSVKTENESQAGILRHIRRTETDGYSIQVTVIIRHSSYRTTGTNHSRRDIACERSGLKMACAGSATVSGMSRKGRRNSRRESAAPPTDAKKKQSQVVAYAAVASAGSLPYPDLR